MILEIDVTVTGPDQVLTGSVAVDVNVPAADQGAAGRSEADLETLRIQQASQALRWGSR